MLYLTGVISIRNKIFTYKILFVICYENFVIDSITTYDYLYNYIEELTKEQKTNGRMFIKINSYYDTKTKREVF